MYWDGEMSAGTRLAAVFRLRKVDVLAEQVKETRDRADVGAG